MRKRIRPETERLDECVCKIPAGQVAVNENERSFLKQENFFQKRRGKEGEFKEN